ncbi:hypothetical protein N4G69_18420 [Streptomyces mirabilis]|nr:hypothetical protein [Streptomyces mirabilis]MCT9107589.1 hypothetical protein [Streptomyces mirabilis]
MSAGRTRRPGDPIPTHTVATVVDAAHWLLTAARADGREPVLAS